MTVALSSSIRRLEIALVGAALVGWWEGSADVMLGSVVLLFVCIGGRIR